MKLLSAIVVSLTSFAAAAPIADTEQTGTSPAVNTAAPLGKRESLTSNCGLTVYPKAGQRAIMNGLFYLNGVNPRHDEPAIIWGVPDQTTRIYCAGKMAFYLSVDPDVTNRNFKVPFEPSTLGHQLDHTFHDCYGGPPADDDISIDAYQFWGNGYNLLVAGNADCSDWNFPSSADY